jgi:hypothetical protein
VAVVFAGAGVAGAPKDDDAIEIAMAVNAVPQKIVNL